MRPIQRKSGYRVDGARALVAVAAAITPALSACSGDSGVSARDDCEPQTAQVAPTVSIGASVVFDWEPACGVALLLVEEDGADQWAVNSPEETWDTPSEANRIVPPVTYGQAPSGTEEDFPAEALVAGTTYELVLWRILPGGDMSGCIASFENACLVAVHAFTR